MGGKGKKEVVVVVVMMWGQGGVYRQTQRDSIAAIKQMIRNTH